MDDPRATADEIDARIRKTLGNRINLFRTARNMSARDIAEAINALAVPGLTVTEGAVRNWESGIASPKRVTQIALAQVLDTAWHTLFTLDGEALS